MLLSEVAHIEHAAIGLLGLSGSLSDGDWPSELIGHQNRRVSQDVARGWDVAAVPVVAEDAMAVLPSVQPATRLINRDALRQCHGCGC